jgi:hypothetical protein
MASPLVAGYAALLAQQQPTLCTDSIANAIVERGTQGVLLNVPAGSPSKLLNINTAAIPPTVPGIASNVITSTDGNSLIVSWDKPCDGGSPLTKTTLSLLLNGKVVKRANVDTNTTAVRFSGLSNGRTYQVVLKSENALGQGIATSRISTVPVRSIRRGQLIRTTLLAKGPENLSLKWSVSSSSKRVCTLKMSPTRLVTLRTGICRIGLRQIDGEVPVLRSLRIAP